MTLARAGKAAPMLSSRPGRRTPRSPFGNRPSSARVVSVLGILLIAGCSGSFRLRGLSPPEAPILPESGIRFRDVTQEYGVSFHAGPSPKSPLNIVELMGGGVGFVDADGDPWPDLLLAGYSGCALYRNENGKYFRDVTAQSGLAALGGGWQGVASADYDGDGRPDLVLTGHNRLALLRSLGNARYEDTTVSSGLSRSGWHTSAAFADVDGDGWLDLFIGRYVDFRAGLPEFFETPRARLTLGPDAYAAQTGVFYRNRGGRFQEATAAAGLDRAQGKVLGVAFGDADGDGDEDLYLANDRVPGDFFRNDGKGRFRNIGVENGTALSFDGNRQAGMGVAWGDYDGDNRLDLVVTTFAGERKGLYRQDASGMFEDQSVPAGLLRPTLPWVGFGVALRDWDNDGRPDLMLANGHVQDQVEQADPSASYAQPLQVFHNLGNGRFGDASAGAGTVFRRPLVGRGLAVADFDRDGRLDVLVGNLADAPRLLRNESRSGHWLAVRLRARDRNTSGIGCRIIVRAGGKTRLQEVRADGSYLSASQAVAHFGLGDATGPPQVVVRWGAGRVQHLESADLDQEIEIRAP